MIRREVQMKLTKMSRAVMPGSANHRNTLYGGVLMDWMDETSGIAAKRFAESDVATVAVERIRFLKPIPVGVFLDVTAEVVKVGNTSLRVKVEAFIDGEPGEEDILAADAEFVYVVLDENGHPKKVGKSL